MCNKRNLFRYLISFLRLRGLYLKLIGVIKKWHHWGRSGKGYQKVDKKWQMREGVSQYSEATVSVFYFLIFINHNFMNVRIILSMFSWISKTCKLLFVFWPPKIEVHYKTVIRPSSKSFYKRAVDFVSESWTTLSSFAKHFLVFFKNTS